MGEYEIQILVQWLMLFALLSIIFFPAIMFRKVALRHHKKGWPYFLAGMGIGLMSLVAARFLTYLLMQSGVLAPTGNSLMAFVLFVALPCLVVTTAVIMFRRSMISDR